MSSDRTLYDVLGVARDADAATLKSAWRAAVKRCHPDLGGTAVEVIEVQTAYALLSNPSRRSAYDRELGSAAAADSDTANMWGDAYSPDLGYHDDVDDLIESFDDDDSAMWTDLPYSSLTEMLDHYHRLGSYCVATTAKGNPCFGSPYQGGPYCWVHRPGGHAPRKRYTEQCRGRTKKGHPCYGTALDNGYCYQHGGRRNAGPEARTADPAHRPSPATRSRTPGPAKSEQVRTDPSAPDKHAASAAPDLPPEPLPPAAPAGGCLVAGGCLMAAVAVVALVMAGGWVLRGCRSEPEPLTFGGSIKQTVVECETEQPIGRQERNAGVQLRCSLLDTRPSNSDRPYLRAWVDGCDETRVDGEDASDPVIVSVHVRPCGQAMSELHWQICQTHGGPLPDDCLPEQMREL